jgi:hypothetical protein
MNVSQREIEIGGINGERQDKRTIRTLPALEAKGIHRWIDGWVDLEARNSIQQLLRKMPRRAMGVKPLPISN